ncbi:MAG: hypothetical protein GY713_23620, partial [Actinomycetia bacterium]|nr:hypothetical protein [Actinomycetes bacterium]
GTTSVFRRRLQKEGTNFCGDGVRGCWRLEETRDAYGNKMWIEYPPYDADKEEETWTIRDSVVVGNNNGQPVYRTHRIVFSRDPDVLEAADGQGSFTTPDGGEWGDLRRLVKRVEVAAFGGGTATYDFNYVTKTMARGCPHDVSGIDQQFDAPGGAVKITLPVLESISVPDSQPYVFKTEGQDGALCDRLNGTITEVVGPTRGKIVYGYQDTWPSPTRCSYHNAPDAEIEYTTAAVKTRT